MGKMTNLVSQTSFGQTPQVSDRTPFLYHDVLSSMQTYETLLEDVPHKAMQGEMTS